LKKLDPVNITIDSWAAECLFGSTYLLLSLSEKDRQVKLNEQINQEKTEQLPLYIFEGYKLAIIVLLHRIINQVIDSPETIGLRRSKKIDCAYQFGTEDKSCIHNLPNGSSQGILVKNLLFFRKKILKTKDWNELWSSVECLRDFLNPMKEIFLSSFTGKVNQSDSTLEPEEALLRKLPELILIFMNDEKLIHLAFNEMYRLQPATKRLEQFKRPIKPKGTTNDLFDLLNKEISQGTLNFMDKADKAGKFLAGYKFANISLWHLSLGEQLWDNTEIFKGEKNATTWSEFCAAFDEINGSVVSNFEKNNCSNETKLVLLKKVPKELRHQLISPIVKQKRQGTSLSEALNHRPGKIISFDGSNGASQFCTVLSGLVYQNQLKIRSEKAQVIEFIHKQKTRGNNYSYALLIPTYSNLADYSKWWIFYRCATDHTGYGGSCFTQIRTYIESLKPFICLKKFRIREENFVDYFKSDYTKFIEKECKKATNDNSLLRGAFLELLVAQIFTIKGYKTLLRHKSEVLGRKEIDVIAVPQQETMGNVVYVVECKERSLTFADDEFHKISKKLLDESRKKGGSLFSVSSSDVMYEILEEFDREKVSLLQNKSEQFLKEIGFFCKNVRIIGVVATTAIIEAPTQASKNVELWTFWTLKDKLQEGKIDKSFIEIIASYLLGKVGRPLSDALFYENYFE
jgi:Holliday junction resolvase-like predicted endonuclease